MPKKINSNRTAKVVKNPPSTNNPMPKIMINFFMLYPFLMNYCIIFIINKLTFKINAIIQSKNLQ